MDNKLLLELAQRHGTPLYVFDEECLKSRIASLRASLPAKTGICYAMKANPFVLPAVSHLVDRIEVCSEGEQRICADLSIDSEKLVISGVNKDEDAIRESIKVQGAAGRYTVESVGQFNMIYRIARSCNARLKILLRLTSGNQFGMDEWTIKELASLYGSDPYLDLCGIQYFSGTQKKSLGRIGKEIDLLGDLVFELQRESDLYIREVEYGPGFPVDYFDDRPRQEVEAEEKAFLEQVSMLMPKMRTRRRIILELGRAIVASCGTYATRVVDTKTNGGENYAIVDGGIHHLTYYGNSLALKKPPCRLVHDKDDQQAAVIQPWTVCGSLCTVNDLLVKRAEFRGLGQGSLLAFEQTGAYCMTEGISLFLSRDLPEIVVVDGLGRSRTVRARLPTSPVNTPQTPISWTSTRKDG